VVVVRYVGHLFPNFIANFVVLNGSHLKDRSRLAGRTWAAVAPLRLGCYVTGVVLALLTISGCHSDMYDQPRYEPAEKTEFFDDQRTMRPVVANTIARGQLREDDAYFTGKVSDAFVSELPAQVKLSETLLARGQERFNIYCSNCHDRVGTGNGMIVQRGFPRPPTYHSDRLRGMPVGYFFEVMTHGYGTMYPFNNQVSVADRWAIAAYIRALQLSQHATLDEISSSERTELEGAKQ